ncbi:MAG: PAS domain S-box protein [Gemmatimonadota bacterium]
MTPEHFLTFANPLPEPMLLLTGSGFVLAGNLAVERQLGLALPKVLGRSLADVVADSTDEVNHYLRSCSRSRSLVLGSLNLLGGDRESVSCRTEGTLLQPRTEGTEAILLLRLIPKESAVGKFVALNQRIQDLGREIRRRRQAEAEARQQAEQLRVTLRCIGDGVIVTDADGRVQLLNTAAQAMTGWTLEDATGKPLTDMFRIVNEYTREPAENPALRALREGVVVGLANHTILVAKNGTERPIDDSAAPIRDDEGTLLGSVLVFRDVTQRQQTEERLRRSERRFRQLADAMPQIVWTAGPDGEIDYMNRRWSDFTGLPETLGNTGWSHVLHPDEAQPAGERWAASVRDGAPFEMQMRLLDRRQQTYRWHLFRTVAVHDDAGRVVRWFGTSTDIHEQKRSEESSRYLAEASAALAGVVDYESTLRMVANLAVPHFADWSAVDVADDGGTLRRLAVAHQDPRKVQLAHELQRQYPPDPLSPNGAFAVLRTGKPEIVTDITDEMLVRGTRDETHLRLIRSLGLKSYICVPLVASGQPLGVLTFATAQSGRTYTGADLALATDLAHRASVAVENTQLYEALRNADRRKDEFLATLAHELRNPLAPIRNALQILKMPRVDGATIARSLEMMERQVEHLVRLVDDLLDVSRVMRGTIELRRERVELAAVVARAVETVQPLVDVQGHRLSIRLPSESLPIDADPVRLVQVVGNLLTNATKYTERSGRIWLTAERDGDTAELRIRDTGIGIGPQMLPRIFELFVQVDHSSTKAQGGLGIGLTLVKNLVEMHHGTVEARSDGLGRGSEFIVRLPMSAQTADRDHGGDPDHPARQSPADSGYRLLVVDDNQDAADSLAILLGLQGHEVRVAFSGVAALEITKAYTPDVVFLDLGMPGIDGYEVARRLRHLPGLETVVLAALTGWGQKEDRRRTSEAGFSHHLVKPPAPKAIEAVLADLKRVRNPQAEG